MGTTETLLRTLLIIAIVLLLFPLLMMMLFIPLMGMGGWGQMGHWTNTGGMGWLGPAIWFGVLLLVLGSSYLAYKAISQTSGQASDAALEELRVAYARGNLSDEEFEQRREQLTKRDRE